MREILFRAKSLHFDKWLEGYYAKGDKDCIVSFGDAGIKWQAVKPETVGQFTGLTDKKGTKIFEGDIVIGYDVWGKEYGRGVVTWNETCSGWYYDNFKGMYNDGISTYKVIGNIHDILGLLEEGADNA